MTSPPSSRLSALSTYTTLTPSRLKALYSDFTNQKHSNPSSYASNVEWWRQTLEAALLRGRLTDGHGAITVQDRLVLHAPGMTFADRFRMEGVGKPLGIPTVISELCSSKALIPQSEFLSETRSIYDSGWLPYRIASFVVGKPLWWALGQLGVVDSSGAAFGDSGATERWKKVRGDYVMVSLLEGAAERILDGQRRKNAGQLADTLYNLEGFRAEFSNCAFEDAPLSSLDIKILLKFLERDKGAIVVRGDVIKFLGDDTPRPPEVTAVDTGVLALKTSIERLQAQIDSIQNRIDERTRQISDALRQKRKEIAMSHLRSRKLLEDVLKKRLSSMGLLQSTLIRVETSAGDIEIMKSYESSTATLREILAHPLLQRDKIDETMDALADANADALDINDTIQRGVEVAQAGTGIDEFDLEAELQVLVEEVEVEKVQAQRKRLSTDELETPAHLPSSEVGEALHPDTVKEKVAVAL